MNQSPRTRAHEPVSDSIRGLSAALRVLQEQLQLAVWAVKGLLIPAAIVVCAVILWKYRRNQKPL